MTIEPQVWLPLASGLIGALIGGGASVLTVLVQARHETRRHRIEVVTGLASKEQEWAYQIMKDMKAKGVIPPPVLWMHYYEKLLNLFDSGSFTLENYRKLTEESHEFRKVLFEIDEMSRADQTTD